MPVTKVKSKWSSGDLYFTTPAGLEITHLDGTNRALVVPTGSSLTVAGVTVDASTLAADAQTGANVAELADVATDGGIPVVFRINASTLTGDVDVTVAYKVRVIDVVAVASAAGGAADTIIVKNGATAITNALDLNVSDKVVVRAGTIDDAQHDIAASGTLRVSGASGVNAIVYVHAIRVA